MICSEPRRASAEFWKVATASQDHDYLSMVKTLQLQRLALWAARLGLQSHCLTASRKCQPILVTHRLQLHSSSGTPHKGHRRSCRQKGSTWLESEPGLRHHCGVPCPMQDQAHKETSSQFVRGLTELALGLLVSDNWECTMFLIGPHAKLRRQRNGAPREFARNTPLPPIAARNYGQARPKFTKSTCQRHIRCGASMPRQRSARLM